MIDQSKVKHKRLQDHVRQLLVRNIWEMRDVGELLITFEKEFLNVWALEQYDIFPQIC